MSETILNTANIAALNARGSGGSSTPSAPSSRGTTYTQGTNPEGYGTVKYDSNTGALLQPGQSFTITPQSIAATQPVNLPTPTTPASANGLMQANNLALSTNLKGLGITTDQSGLFQSNPVDSTTDNAAQLAQGRIDAYLKLQRPNAEQIYNSSGKAQVDAARAEVQNYTGQINNIVAKAQADQMSLVGQGRGIPEVIIGGQQAQVQREATIKALPLQALLANAQGNLELAQENLNTTFKLRMEDAQNQFDFGVKIIDSVFDAADKQEQRRLDDLKETRKENFQRITDSVNFAQELSSQATQNGDVKTAAKFAAIQQPNPSSKTFAQDLATYNQKVAAVQATMKPDALRKATIDNINSQRIAREKEEFKLSAAEKKQAAQDLKTAKATLPALKTKINNIDGLLESPGLSTLVGPNALARVNTKSPIKAVLAETAAGAGAGAVVGAPFGGVGAIPGAIIGGATGLALGVGTFRNDLSGANQKFAGDVQYLTSNEFLDALADIKGRGVNLNPLSDKEGAAVRAAATKINFWEKKDKNGVGLGVWDIDQETFKEEVKRLRDNASAMIRQAEGVILDDTEDSVINDAYKINSQTFDANLYY